MVAIDEIILESKLGGKSTGRRGTSFSSAAEVYPVRAGIVQKSVDLVASPFPIFRAFESLSGCLCGENQFLLPDTPIPRHRDLGSSLDVDRCSLVTERNADAFGNALGFNAATALTTYLYSSMPFDAASGSYYDHARFYDSGTGSFTQADFGYVGSLANPMTDLPYAFTGGDPINMLDLSGHDFSLGSLTVGIGIASMLNGAIGGVVGGVQSGALGALGGALNGFVAISVGFTTALLLDPLGPIGYGLGFGFGAIAGESLDLAIQGKALSSPEARIDVAVSGVLGFFGGVTGGEAAVSYAGEIGQRLIGYPAIRASMTEIANGQGVYTVGAVEFVQYYSEHPWQFANILTKFISEKSVGENLFETAKAIIGGLAVSRAQDTLVSVLVQPVSEFMQAFQALEQNIENNSGGNQVSAGGSQ